MQEPKKKKTKQQTNPKRKAKGRESLLLTPGLITVSVLGLVKFGGIIFPFGMRHRKPPEMLGASSRGLLSLSCAIIQVSLILVVLLKNNLQESELHKCSSS